MEGKNEQVAKDWTDRCLGSEDRLMGMEYECTVECGEGWRGVGRVRGTGSGQR